MPSDRRPRMPTTPRPTPAVNLPICLPPEGGYYPVEQRRIVASWAILPEPERWVAAQPRLHGVTHHIIAAELLREIQRRVDGPRTRRDPLLLLGLEEVIVLLGAVGAGRHRQPRHREGMAERVG